MSLYRIQNALLNRPWLIKPEVHQSMIEQLQTYLQGRSQLPNMPLMPDNDPEDDPNDQNAPQVNSGTIAVIPVDGVIGKHLSLIETACGGVDLDQVSQELIAARDNPAIEKIAMLYNTPGGTVTGVPETGELIAEISKVKPVYSYTATIAASAGYWLGSQSTAFYCSPSSDIGSVGVYSIYLDKSQKLKQEGIAVDPIFAGQYKLIGVPWKPLSKDERAMLQADIDKIYSRFVSAVLSKRSINTEYLQGQTFDGEQAVEYGFTDGLLNTTEDFLSFIQNV